MEKTTILQIKSLNGADVTVTIDRSYGYETVMVNADGDKVAVKQWEDACRVTASVETKYGLEVFSNPSITVNAQLGHVICGYATLMGKHIAIKIQISSKDYDAIVQAETEQLTEAINPDIVARIEQAKQCERNDMVLPSRELQDKRRRYNDAFNDGGFGSTPYDCYMTTEEVEQLRATYPALF